MVRNSLRFVSWKDYKAVTKGLKEIYQATTEENASQKWTMPMLDSHFGDLTS